MLNKKDKLLAAAQKFLERGSLDKALLEFQRAAQEDAKDTRTWLRIAEIHVKRNEAAQATDVYLKTAELYVEQGFFQRAAAVYKNVLKLTPGHTGAHTKLAEVYRQLGLLSDSSQQYELAAAALVKAAKPKEAMAALGQILEMNPDQVMVRVKIAEVAAQAGLNDDAVREFLKAAEQLESQGRTEDFLRVAERVLQLAPNNIVLGKKAAVRYMERNNPKAALAKLQACFNADGKDVETLQLLANAFSELGQNAKTITVLKELAKIQEERRQHGERAATLQRIHSLDPSEPLVADLDVPRTRRPTRNAVPVVIEEPESAPLPSVDRRVRREPSITFSELAVPPILMREPSGPLLSPGETALPSLDEEQVAAEVGRLLTETDTFVKYGLIERAAEHVRKVFDLAPEHEQAQERLIAILVQLGRTGEAVEELGILADRRSLSDPEAAIGHLERALELDPTAVGAQHMLSRLTEQHPRALAVELDDPEVLELDELEEMDFEPMLEPVEAEAVAVAVEPDDDAASEWDDGGGHTQIDPGILGASSAPAASAPSSATVVLNPPPGWAANPTGTPAKSPLAAPFAPGAPLLDELDIEFDLPASAGPDRTGAREQTTLSAPVLEAPLDPAVEGELEQVDFFLEQGMPDEAHALLDELGKEVGRHPAVLARRARIDQLRASGDGGGDGDGKVEMVAPDADDDFEEATRMKSPAPAAAAFDRRLGGPDTGAVPRGQHSNDSARTPVRDAVITPRAVVASGADATTQRDLGIAYKEMGLADAAIAEFAKLTDDPEHQVFALMTMGECYESEGAFAEALLHYKKALNRSTVREDEATRLYFLLGRAFEALGDQGEALYFFEKVARRDAAFGDVGVRVRRLRESGVSPIDRGGADDRRRSGAGGAGPRGSRSGTR